MRDPHGVRPLVLGKQGDAFVLASEPRTGHCGASFVRDLDPGEMVIIDKNGIISRSPSTAESPFLYF